MGVDHAPYRCFGTGNCAKLISANQRWTDSSWCYNMLSYENTQKIIDVLRS